MDHVRHNNPAEHDSAKTEAKEFERLAYGHVP